MDEQAERCIPWDPIPHAYSHAPGLGITQFGEVRDGTPDGIAFHISAHLPGETAQRGHRWRLFFAALAYRLNPVGWWPEALPLTMPPMSWSVSGKERVAFWEITSSRYLAQSVDPSMRDGAHHYVILYHDTAYEVIALYYTVDDLGPIGQ